jgi:hypothetical protein
MATPTIFDNDTLRMLAARSVTGQKPLQYQTVWSISKGTNS